MYVHTLLIVCFGILKLLISVYFPLSVPVENWENRSLFASSVMCTSHQGMPLQSISPSLKLLLRYAVTWTRPYLLNLTYACLNLSINILQKYNRFVYKHNKEVKNKYTLIQQMCFFLTTLSPFCLFLFH